MENANPFQALNEERTRTVNEVLRTSVPSMPAATENTKNDGGGEPPTPG